MYGSYSFSLYSALNATQSSVAVVVQISSKSAVYHEGRAIPIRALYTIMLGTGREITDGREKRVHKSHKVFILGKKRLFTLNTLIKG